MKKLMIAGAAVFFMTICGGVASDFWVEDFDEASKKAQDSGKYLLVNFTGSDWCGWCIRLDKEVFSTSEFKQYAQENLVGAYIDFPRRKPMPEERAQRNLELAQQYQVPGYPTILILAPDGSLVERTGYRPGGPEAYIEHLESIIAAHEASDSEAADGQ